MEAELELCESALHVAEERQAKVDERLQIYSRIRGKDWSQVPNRQQFFLDYTDSDDDDDAFLMDLIDQDIRTSYESKLEHNNFERPNGIDPSISQKSLSNLVKEKMKSVKLDKAYIERLKHKNFALDDKFSCAH